MVVFPLPPSIFDRNGKNVTPLCILYGEKTFRQFFSPNHWTDFDNFYFIRKLMTLRYVINVRLLLIALQFRVISQNKTFSESLCLYQTPFRQVASIRTLILRATYWSPKAASLLLQYLDENYKFLLYPNQGLSRCRNFHGGYNQTDIDSAVLNRQRSM
ncbi:hypothetical protein AVEN_137814-1 [Araneus ventricosus]|uniref:Uncharacterized protein n=1 Tax=Araneus ventricosus TaxID=182803 RepID=A0A4Y2QM82_ARAVE|nr:hypothetical protein AVEN_33565-1 [Araneus ventricosus]GBN64421.1 hypothetical protein AVEN_137814-1 [Araneus ventricosus]